MSESDSPNNDEMVTATPSEKELTTASEQDSDVEEIAHDLESLPPDMRREVRSFLAMVQSGIRPSPNIVDKFTEEHIHKYLDYIQRDDDHAHELRKSNRWFYLAYFVIAIMMLAGAVVYLLPRDKEFLESIIQILIILAGGVGAGYGIKSKDRH